MPQAKNKGNGAAPAPARRPGQEIPAGAVAAGVAGGKTWYAAVHQGRKWDGWCIQGFVAGVAVVVAAVAIAGPGLPAGAFLAAMALIMSVALFAAG